MNNISIENKLEQLDDIMTHIGYVIKAGHKLCKQLMLNGEEDDAIKLLQRILVHDASKATTDEFYGMAKFSQDKGALKDLRIKQVENEDKMIPIKLHWLNNDHHPECWTDKIPETLTNPEPIEISKGMNHLAIAEMCCDWYSRSLQFNTDVMEFYQLRSKDRWIFTNEQHKLIIKYLSLLQE